MQSGTRGPFAALAPLGWIYGLAARARNGLYSAGIYKTQRLPVPAISVGNLTVGGTGKTPCTFYILNRAAERKVKVAVLTRGYGGGGGANDEVWMLRDRFPSVAVDIGADRRAAAERSIANGPPDVFLLDDGFQHRRVARDLNILLIDACDPFGGGAYLPAGRLREPVSGVARANIIILTRVDQAAPGAAGAIWDRLSHYKYNGPRVEAAHAPESLEPLDPNRPARPVESLRDCEVHLLSSIARPDSFESTIRSLGARIVEHRAFPDHYHYRPADLPDLRDARDGRELWCVTEKDAPKLRRLGAVDGYMLKVQFTITAGRAEFDAAIDGVFIK